ncbi:MAG: FAD:protein FMN transferase [Mariprofundaceae bacterium]|nr:FAD:protein FMN transferase [Mariprofundaceae bacterium]
MKPPASKTRAVSLLASALIFAACAPAPQDVKESRFIMGTLVTFTIAGAPRDQALNAVKASATEMQRIEDVFTIYGDHPNAVKALNASQPGTPVTLPGEVSKLLQQSLDISRQSGGAFTPVIGSLSLLWGFSLPDPPNKPPSVETIHAALSGVHNNLIEHHGNAWKRLNAQTKLDFGAIAKGYAIDRGIEVLRAHGIKSAILDAGGDLRAIGSHNGKPWRIGIRHPRDKNKTIGWFEVHGDISIVTSGDYERFFIYQGKRYHHIMVPATGMPAMKTMSATIVASNATLADGWSTALFVAGPDGLKKIQNKGFQAVLMDASGHLYQTPDTLVPFHAAPIAKNG